MQESLVPQFTLEQLKHSAKLIRKYFKTIGIELTNSTALDIASNGIEYDNYNIARVKIMANVCNTSGAVHPKYTLNQLKHYAKLVGNYIKSFNSPPIALSDETVNDIAAYSFGYDSYTAAESLLIEEENKLNILLYGIQAPTPPKYHYMPSRYKESGQHTLWEESMRHRSPSIDFIPMQSTALFGITGSGKTYQMLHWADHILRHHKSMPFVYFLKQDHFIKNENGNYRIYDASGDVQARIALIEHYVIGQRSAVFALANNMEYSIISNVLQSAMKHGYHIFIDENRFLMEMLDEVLDAGYSNFAVAIQSFRSMFYRGINNIRKYRFNRILVGQQSEHAGSYFQHKIIGTELYSSHLDMLNRGFFYVANNSEK